MTEQYGFKFVVDANDAAKGWKQFSSAIEGVFRSLDKMEAHVEKTMGTVKKSSESGKKSVQSFTRAAGDLAKIKVNPTAAKNIAALNGAMKSFKAPSAAQVKNMQSFFRSLEKAGTGGGATAARNIAALSAAMNGFKAPSAANVKNLLALFKAMQAYPSGKNFTNAAGMLSTLRQLSGFKAPGAAQVRNLQTFLNTVGNLKIPRNGSQIARVLEQIARAASASSRHLRGFRSDIGGINWNRFNNGARTASINMMGLQNSMSATYQIGSVLRSLFGALTVAELGRSFLDAANRVVTFNAAMKVISTEAGFANEQLGFVTDTALRLGLDYGKSAEAFGKFAISADKAGASAEQARNIFEGFGTAMSVMGLAADKQNDVMLAMQQVMNKGYLAGEELNQQLNEHLPGALGFLREELDKTGIKLEDALKKKMLDGTQALLFLASKYRDEFGPALEDALNRPAAQANILRTNMTKLFESMANNGGNEGVVTLLKRINAYMRPEDLERYGKAIGELINKWMLKLADAVDWLAKNWDSLKGPLATTVSLLGKWMLISGTLQIGQALTAPIIGAVGALRNMVPLLGQSVLLMRALNAQSLAGLAASVRAMDPATLALLTRLRGIRRTLTTMPPNPMAALRTGLTKLSTLSNTVGGSFLKMGGVIAAGLTIAMSVVRDENKKYAHDSYTTTEIVKGFFLTLGDNISDIWTKVTTFMADRFGWVGDAISDTIRWLQNFFKAFFINLSFGFSKVGEGIYLSFKTAFEGVIGMIRDVGSALYKLFSGDFAGAGAAAMNAFTLKAFQTAGTNNFKGFATDLPGQRDQFADNAERGFGIISDQLAAYGERGSRGDKDSKRPEDVAAREYIDSLYDPDKLIRDGTNEDGSSGSKGGSKRKGRTPREVDPMKELDRLQRRVDQIMGRLADANPVLQVQRDFVAMVTENAQAILTDDSYAKWMEKLKTNTDGVTGAIELLQDQMDAGGADQAVLNDLAARYGVTVEDVTELLYKQGDAFRFLTKEAKNSMTFGFELKRLAKEELQFAMLSNDEAKIMADVQAEVLRFKQNQWEIDQGMIDTLTEQLRLQQQRVKLFEAERQFYENNALINYKNEIRSVGELVQDLDNNFLSSLEEQLTSLGTTGKFSFGAIFDTIQQGLVEWSAQGITDAIGGLLSNGDEKNPNIFGGLMSAMGFKNTGFDKDKAMERINAQQVNLYAARVDTDGNLLTGLFGDKLGPSKDSAGALGEIVVNGYDKQQELEDVMTQPMASAAAGVADIMKNDWGSAAQGIGAMLSSLTGGGAGAGGGIGGLIGSALSMVGSFGLFKEGGLSTQPVSVWKNAPHYSEGTHNTTPGIPAVLHDNEAVIPLSRGRKVPVALTNGGGSGSGTVIHQNFNIQTPNADSFKLSQQQMSGQMHRAASRAHSRNKQ